jgi:hypothetical protein
MSKLILKDNISFEKDTQTGAIINRDTKTYNALKRKKELQKEKEKEMAELKSDVKNLTSLVEKLIQKIDK